MKKRTILFFIYDGFADWETSYALTGIRLSNMYHVKTIALRLEPVLSSSGLTIFPDLDFFPETDLSDIDSSTVAMLMLPGGYLSEKHDSSVIHLLIAHCIQNTIPVVSMCDTKLLNLNVALLDTVDAGIHDQVSYDNVSVNNFQDSDDLMHSADVLTENVTTAKALTSTSFANSVFELLNIRNNVHVATWFNHVAQPETDQR